MMYSGIKGNALRVSRPYTSSATRNAPKREYLRYNQWMTSAANHDTSETLEDAFCVRSLNGANFDRLVSQSVENFKEKKTNLKTNSRPKTATIKRQQINSRPMKTGTSDNDTDCIEHLYIMQRALAAYKEHTESRPQSYVTLSRPVSAGGRKEEVNCQPTTLLPQRPSSAKIVYKNVHRPSSARRKNRNLSSKSTGNLNQTRKIHERDDSVGSFQEPQPSLHSPRASYGPTRSFVDISMLLDSDIINAVGRANSVIGTSLDRPTKDSSRPVLHTQKVDINQSFDKLGFGAAEHKQHANKNHTFDGTFFSSARTQKKPCFVIHPEWVSESFSVKGISLQGKKQDGGLFAAAQVEQRRCKSAPPPRSRNPITWENW